MNLSNKVALVTGSGRGIGRAIVLKLAEAGAIVIANDYDEKSNIENLVREIITSGGHGLAVLGDVSSSVDVDRLLRAIIDSYGRVDILVNNAGITKDQIVLRMSEKDWDAVININLKSVFLCTKAVLKYMIKQKWGRIINIASVVGIVGNVGQANYSSSKAGIIGFTKTVAKEVGSRNITVNAIAPGFIDTRMTKNISGIQKQDIEKRIPLGYVGTPQDVAEAVSFLASDEARYITGQVINIDGGMSGI